MDDNIKRAAKCYQHGVKAMQARNWDMATQMFSQCVKLVPEYLNYRQVLRNSTKEKYGQNKKGAGTFDKTKIMSLRGKIKKAKQKEQWEEVSMLAEEGLLLNPWDVQLNVDVAEANQKLDRGEIAKFAYIEAINAAPRDKDIHVAFAQMLEDRSEYSEAFKVWERVQVIDPKDIEVSRKLAGLAALQAKKAGGYEDAEGSRDVAVNKNFGNEGKSVSAKTAETETALRHAIRREPEQVEHYLKLSGHLKQAKKYEESYDIMKQALEVSGGDPGIREQFEDAELVLMNYNVEMAKERANESESLEDRQKAVEMSKEYRARRIEVLSSREQRHQQNMNIKIELAELIMQLQDWPRAIPLLQKASQDPRLKTQAQVMLGKCFMYDKKLSLAKGQFERAVPELNSESQPETYKEAHYLLARVSEETGDTEKAIHHYGEVLVIDYDYRDARDRLEKLQSS